MSSPSPSPHHAAIERHAQLLQNRVAKTYRHLRKRLEKAQIGAYRLYDWDVPEVRARVDYYEGHLVVAEYEREQTRAWSGYLEALGLAAARAVGVSGRHVHLKRRRTRQEGSAQGRYERLARKGERLAVRERDLRFWVNLDDFIDTGLFCDHRETRAWLRSGKSKRFLNLYCYTGAFTCALAKGLDGAEGARTTSVDLSSQYLDWARDNLKLNQIDPSGHEFVARDSREFLFQAAEAGRTWDLVFVDPPSFSTVGSFDAQATEFDILRDHAELSRAALACVEPGGRLVMSTNHQRFEPQFGELGISWEEITHRTVPEDFRQRASFDGRPVHRCFVLHRAK